MKCERNAVKENSSVELMLPDGKRITAPTEIDISGLDALDELEYEMWNTIESYLQYFGIKIENDEPDWATVKTVHDSLLTVLIDAGVNFKTLTQEQRQEIEGEKEM